MLVTGCTSVTLQWWSERVFVSAAVVRTLSWLPPSTGTGCQARPYCGKRPPCYCTHNKLQMTHLFIHLLQ